MRSLFARLHRRYGQKITGDERQRYVAQLIVKQENALKAAHKAETAAVRGIARPRVAVIGAGFAGLMAGYMLARKFDVTIFEARDRVGGRVWSKMKSSGIVEAGGELIGYNHPLWLHLARLFDLSFSVNTSDQNFDALHLDMPLYLDGDRLTKSQQEQLYEDMDEVIGKMVQRARHVNPKRPWLSYQAETLDQKSVAQWMDELRFKDKRFKSGRRLKKRVRLALEQQFANDGGRPCDDQSYLANLAVVAGGMIPHIDDAFFTLSETLRCTSGNQSLADCLAAEIRKLDGVIHLLSPVNAIEIDDDKVTIKAEGRTLEEADYVILAIPPSLWPDAKRFASLTITPKLPQDYYVKMGKAVKYLSSVKSRFWIGENLAPTATSTDFGVTWEGTDNQIAAPGRDVALNLFAGDEVAESALRRWKKGGSRAVDAFYAARIGKVYKAYKKHLSQPPEFMAWPEDPWTGAGYSCLAPGEVCRAGPLLQKGFAKRMFFAGEHTCFAYMGYMEGALQSGQAAARSIVAATKRGRGT